MGLGNWTGIRLENEFFKKYVLLLSSHGGRRDEKLKTVDNEKSKLCG